MKKKKAINKWFWKKTLNIPQILITYGVERDEVGIYFQVFPKHVPHTHTHTHTHTSHSLLLKPVPSGSSPPFPPSNTDVLFLRLASNFITSPDLVAFVLDFWVPLVIFVYMIDSSSGIDSYHLSLVSGCTVCGAGSTRHTHEKKKWI